MEFHGMPCSSTEFHVMPWNSMDCPWRSMDLGVSVEFHGVLRSIDEV